MKSILNIKGKGQQRYSFPSVISLCILCLAFIAVSTSPVLGQEEAETKKDTRPVRDIFASSWLIDNQSVVVPIKGTFQMDIIHRFGVMKNGFDDALGIFAPSNIKLGFNYTVVNNLSLGFGLTKDFMTWDGSVKYALLQQTRSGSTPLSITYFGNMAIDTRSQDKFESDSDRLSYFHQLILARKLSPKLSIQLAPSLSHYNAVEGFINPEQNEEALMENDHIAIALSARFKLKDQMNLIVNFDQPITDHASNNPNANISFGIELVSSAHAFQIFVGNYKSIVPQRNNVFNSNDFGDGEILLGFNITRLWN